MWAFFGQNCITIGYKLASLALYVEGILSATWPSVVLQSTAGYTLEQAMITFQIESYGEEQTNLH